MCIEGKSSFSCNPLGKTKRKSPFPDQTPGGIKFSYSQKNVLLKSQSKLGISVNVRAKLSLLFGNSPNIEFTGDQQFLVNSWPCLFLGIFPIPSVCKRMTQLGIRGGFGWIIINQQHCAKVNLISPQMLHSQP